jgi:hypothetical protein
MGNRLPGISAVVFRGGGAAALESLGAPALREFRDIIDRLLSEKRCDDWVRDGSSSLSCEETKGHTGNHWCVKRDYSMGECKEFRVEWRQTAEYDRLGVRKEMGNG